MFKYLRRALVLASVATAFVAVPASANAATLSIQECRETIAGIPSTNDHDNNIAVNKAEYWWAGQEYRRWYSSVGFQRIDYDDVRVTVWLEFWDGRIIEIRQRCWDDNHTGQISSEEDYTMFWDPYNF